MNARPGSGLTLVLGPPNSGKRGLVLEWWQERLALRPVVTMPTIPDAEEMSVEMARRTRGLVGQSPALNIAGLAHLVVGTPCRYMDGLQRDLVVAHLLRTTPLEALGAYLRLPGISDATAALLQELLDSGKGSEEISEVLDRWAQAEPKSAALAHDIGSLLGGFERTAAALGVVERAAIVREAARTTEGWERPVAFCGFSSFTQGQRALAAKLSEQVELLVTLTYDRGQGTGLCPRAETEWWIEHAAQVLEVNPRARAYASPAIAHLERSFLGVEAPASPAPASGSTEGVRFLLASGRRAEAELVAQHVAALIRAGFEPGGIAVVVRQVGVWAGLLEEVFASCAIPCQIDRHRQLSETGLGHALLAAMRGAALDDAESLLSYLGGPYSDCAPEAVSDLETSYRRSVLRGGAALSAMARGEVAGALRGALALLRPGAGVAGTDSTMPSLDLEVAGALAGRMLLAGTKRAAGEREFEADARAYRAAQGAIEAMRANAAVAGGDLEIAVAMHLLSQVEVSEPAVVDPQAVQVLSAQRARARRFEVVFVLGLVEGEFPGVSERPSLLGGRERAALDGLAGGILSPDSSDESALFVGVVSRAWRLLYLSARDTEDDGSEVMPSRFWERAKILLGVEGSEQERRSLADQVYAPGLAPSLRHYLRACAAVGRAPRAGASGPEPFAAAPSWRRAPARLTSPDALADLQAHECFSPSALESFLRCPFAWFVDRVLGREQVELEMDGRMLGELIHRALGEGYRSLAADGRLPLKPVGLAEAEIQICAAIDGLVAGPDCPGSAAERRVAAWRLKSMARRALGSDAASGGMLAFSEAERDVGGEDGADIGGLKIRGRVDRVDTTPDGEHSFVIDYKSGAAPKGSAIGTAEGLQLPLYLQALSAERGGAHVVGGAYLSLSDGEMTGVVKEGAEPLLGSRKGKVRTLDEDGWRELFENALEVAESAVADMRSGRIAPQDRGTCPGWCDLGPACRARREGSRP